MRKTIARAPRSIAAALLALIAASCDSPTEPKTPAIAVALTKPSLTLGQAETDSIHITVARSNFDGPVTLSVSGFPANIWYELTPNPLGPGETRSRLQIWTTGNAIPGTHTITVRAEGANVAPQSATMTFTINVTGNYALGTASPTVTVAQGGAASTAVAVTRNGRFQADVALAVSGVPSGMTATIDPSTTGSGGALLRLAATSAVPTGTYTLTITGTTPGLPDRTTTVSVKVIAPPSTQNISFTFCEPYKPIWVGYQNEGYAWQRATSADNTFTFPATEKLGLALVFQFGNAFEVIVHYTARDEHDAVNLPPYCTGSKTVSGSTSGIAADAFAVMAMGQSLADASANAPNFELEFLRSGPLDLVAAHGRPYEIDSYFGPQGFIPDRFIIRRSLDVANGATIPVLDFAGSEAFEPASTTLNVVGRQAGDQTFVDHWLNSAGSTEAILQSVKVTTPTTTLYSLPAAQRAASDLHELYVSALTGSNLRRVHLSYVNAPSDRDVVLGPAVGTPTTMRMGGTSYAMMRGQVASQAEYAGAVKFIFGQLRGGSRNVHVAVTAAYLGGTPAIWDVTIPDFAGAAGFNNSWMPSPEQVPAYQLDAYSASFTSLAPVLPLFGRRVDGDVFRYSVRHGAAVDGQPLAAMAPSAAMARTRTRDRTPPSPFLSRP